MSYKMMIVIVVLCVLVMAGWRSANEIRCTGAFPFDGDNPWRAVETSAEQLTATLWLVDSNPDLEMIEVAAESPDCFVVIFRAVE